jgi:hypothetical protein
VKKAFLALAVAVALAGGVRANDDHDDKKKDDDHFEFKGGTLILSRSVYAGTPSILTPLPSLTPTKLPPGCVVPPAIPADNPPVPAGDVPVSLTGGGEVPVKVKGCAVPAVADGTYPTVFNNDTADGSFGVTSPIYLDNISTDGSLLGTLTIPSDQIVTSFSSKSELALNLSLDKKSITFVGYRGNSTNPTQPNVFDVSNSNTPGVIDPTNPVVSQYYRAVAEVDAGGHIQYTEGNAYSGNNGRAAIKGDSVYYMTGNDNNGNLSSSQLMTTVPGVELLGSTGVELLYPGQTAPLPPNINKIGDFEINQVINPLSVTVPKSVYVLDKAGKDNNFRGLTIHDHTLYVTKGSGGNGINTVYQVGDSGTLPTGSTADLLATPIKVLPGFTTFLASGLDQATGKIATPLGFPFGIWFADDNTLYVADEGDGCTANSAPTCPDILTVSTTAPVVTSAQASASIYTHAKNQTGAGLQKWIFDTTTSTWNLAYTIQAGLNLGVAYSVPDNPGVAPNYPAPTDINAGTELLWGPATDGLRNITGRVNHDGTVTIWAVTSTVSGSGDQGADPNHLVKVTDKIKATSPAVGDGDHDKDDSLDQFTVIRSAKSGEVLRGITNAPRDHDGDDHGDDGHGN